MSSAAAFGATTAPPMLDITRQCDANSRHNATAMSECVVAESEARSEILQKWDKLSDANVQKCVKIGRKAKRLPYSAMVKCLSVEQVELTAPRRPAKGSPVEAKPADAKPADAKPADVKPLEGSPDAPRPQTPSTEHDSMLPSWLSSRFKH